MVTLHVIAALIGAGLLCAIDKAIARTLANAARGIATALGCTPQRLKTSTRLHTAPSGIDTPATARSVLLAAWRFLRGPPRLALHDLSP
jgi:hypothetical protein